MSVRAGSTRRIFEAGLWTIAAGMPLAWSGVLFAEYTLPKVLLLSIGLLAAGLGWALFARKGKGLWPRTELDTALAFVGAALVLCSILSVDRYLSFFGRYNEYSHGLWGMLLCWGVFLAFARGPGGDAVRDRVWLALVGAGGLVAAYAALQGLGFEPFVLSRSLPEGRAVSTFGGPVYLGMYLIVVAPLALHSAFAGGRGGALGSVCLALVGGGLLAAVSRGAWIGAGVGVAAYLILRGGTGPRRGWTRGLWAALLLAGALIAVTAAARLSAREMVWPDVPRLEVWKAAWASFLDKPATGWGPDAFEPGLRLHKPLGYVKATGVVAIQVHAHNDVLQALCTTGVLGTAAYFFFLWGLALAAKRRLEDPAGRGRAAALAGSLAGLFVGAKFNPAPLGALAISAAAAGLLIRPRGEREAGGRAAAWALAALGLISTTFAVRLALADRALRSAISQSNMGQREEALAGFGGARRLNPWELEIDKRTFSFLQGDPEAAGGGKPRCDALLSGARAAVMRHPHRSHAHYILGVALLCGDVSPPRLSRAEKALDRALELDPLSLGALEVRLSVARAKGDLDLARTIEGTLRRMEAD